MAYELVDLSTANVVGFYQTERQALADVVDSIRRYGRESVATLALGFNDPHGPGYAIAEGEQLADRALAALATTTSNGRPQEPSPSVQTVAASQRSA